MDFLINNLIILGISKHNHHPHCRHSEALVSLLHPTESWLWCVDSHPISSPTPSLATRTYLNTCSAPQGHNLTLRNPRFAHSPSLLSNLTWYIPSCPLPERLPEPFLHYIDYQRCTVRYAYLWDTHLSLSPLTLLLLLLSCVNLVDNI